MSYLDNPDDLIQDTKNFLKSEYGKYLMAIIAEMGLGHLSKADNMESPYPERYLAKHSALKEVLDLIYTPLDNNIPS